MSVSSDTKFNRINIDSKISRDEYVGLALVIGLIVADIIISIYAIQNGVTESNPIANAIIDGYGTWAIIPFRLASIILLGGFYIILREIHWYASQSLLTLTAAHLTYVIIANAIAVRLLV